LADGEADKPVRVVTNDSAGGINIYIV